MYFKLEGISVTEKTILKVATILTSALLFIVDTTMMCVFLKMYAHFLKVKRNAMKEKLIQWKFKNTMHVVGIIGLVLLNFARTIFDIITN
jgi:hypothetical protein